MKKVAVSVARRSLQASGTRRTIYYGVNFPVTKHRIPLFNHTNDDRSTLETDKHVFAAAVAAVDPDLGAKIDLEKKWRSNYPKHVVDCVRLQAQSEKNAHDISEAGLKYCYDSFDFFKKDGQIIKFADALKEKDSMYTGTIKGMKKERCKTEIEIPYRNFVTGEFKKLKGQELIDQVNRWVDYGTIEGDCGEAIKDVVKNPSWLDLRDQHFVLLGAGSAMGPFHLLKELGAHIIAVDIDSPALWKRLIDEVKYNSAGDISFPMKVPYTGQEGKELYSQCGANMITDTPAVRNWLMQAVPELCQGKPVTMGAYAYLDSEFHVRVNLACDAIMSGVMDTYGADKVALHYLPTPTDAYVIPEPAAHAIKDHYKNAPSWQKGLEMALKPFGRMVPNKTQVVKRDDEQEVHIMNGLVETQGPNYSLAKRIQQWRAILARQEGARVCFHVAPATATQSVVHNKLFAAAYGGSHYFKPVEIFYQEFSSAICGTLLINDIKNPGSCSNPQVEIKHGIMAWLGKKAFHGGFLRVPYSFSSIGEVAATIYFINQAKAAFNKKMKTTAGKAVAGTAAMVVAYFSYHLTIAGAA